MNRSFSPIAIILIGTAMLASCSRPTVYLQPSARETFATNIPAASAELPVIPSACEQLVTPSMAQANAAIDQMEVLVSSDRKLAENKSVQKRLARIRTALAGAATEAALAKPEALRKQNLMERLMIRKINKKISKQLAPNNPEKTMASKDVLTIGAVLVIAGIILALATSGTVAVIGLIAAILGLVFLLFGLL